MGALRPINEIKLYNRSDCCASRLSNYSVLVGNDAEFATNLYDSGNQETVVGSIVSFPNIGVTARYVRVQRNADSLDGGNNAISLAEVEVLGASLFGFSNLAPGSTPSQSSTLANPAMPDASKAIDGDLANAFGSGSTTHTAPGAGGPVFWETSLASPSSINEIALYNRGDCCGDRLSNFRVSIFDGTTEVWGEDYFTGGGNASSIFSIQEDTGGFIASGDRVRVELIGGLNNGASGTDVLSLREVEIYGVAVPEPSSMALVALGLLPLLRRRRK
ncbi:discoidin domain-containing protein [Akkermansiaceae bacterium]|nr:discoidin domain-containing protein [Akkermansiaceae bacterium]